MVREVINRVFVVLEDVCFDGCPVNFLNEDLQWFCGKRTLIDGSVYMRLNEGVL